MAVAVKHLKSMNLNFVEGTTKVQILDQNPILMCWQNAECDNSLIRNCLFFLPFFPTRLFLSF